MNQHPMQIPDLQDEKKSFIIMEPHSTQYYQHHLHLQGNSDPSQPASLMSNNSWQLLPPGIAYNITQQSQPIPVGIQESIRTSHSHSSALQTSSMQQSDVSQSVRNINQKLGDLSNRIKDAKPVVISYGEQGRPPVTIQQTSITRGITPTSNSQQVQFRYVQ